MRTSHHMQSNVVSYVVKTALATGQHGRLSHFNIGRNQFRCFWVSFFSYCGPWTSSFGGFLTTLTKDIPITLDRFRLLSLIFSTEIWTKNKCPFCLDVYWNTHNYREFRFWNRTIKVHIAGIDPRTLLLLTLWSTCRATDAAVHLSRLTAATVTLVIHRNLQAIFEAHWLDGEAVVGTMWRAASCFHTHIKWNLMKKAVKKLSSFHLPWYVLQYAHFVLQLN